MNDKFKNVKKYIDEYDYYALLRDGAPDDEFVSEALSTDHGNLSFPANMQFV